MREQDFQRKKNTRNKDLDRRITLQAARAFATNHGERAREIWDLRFVRLKRGNVKFWRGEMLAPMEAWRFFNLV